MTGKLKILGLHGHAQDAEVFRRKTGGLRGAVKSIAEFDFLSAPHKVERGEDGDEVGYSWYRYDSGMETLTISLRQSLDEINSIFKAKGPFDGIFAFSQGSSLAILLAALQSEQDTPLAKALRGEPFPVLEDRKALASKKTKFQFPLGRIADAIPEVSFRFIAIFAGFLPRDEPFRSLVTESSPPVNSFHCYGEKDQIITKEMSQDAAHVFKQRTVEMHGGGHFVPSSSGVRKAFKSFMQSQVHPS
uniref:Serine hydrolase domain-containing protein n=1 Tax=Rhodosorus marinus TaxID=101924 RepID=A0A7S2ZR97_9RHOD|mmetsp:Transcript_29487/g.114055  ORF Transcript_29487/g.114055 Transcript_29487/m.114055 type:complete len:246 (+) Transcript_29487:170-907(+)